MDNMSTEELEDELIDSTNSLKVGFPEWSTISSAEHGFALPTVEVIQELAEELYDRGYTALKDQLPRGYPDGSRKKDIGYALCITERILDVIDDDDICLHCRIKHIENICKDFPDSLE